MAGHNGAGSVEGRQEAAHNQDPAAGSMDDRDLVEAVSRRRRCPADVLL
jgi:hypothetical protein